MSFAANVVNNKIEKHSLCIIRPRIIVDNFTVFSTDVYVADFTYGFVNMVASTNVDFLTEVASVAAITTDTFYWDHENKKLYVGYLGSPNTAGLTVEYELHLSTDAFTGPRDPLDSTSQVVDWLPVLDKVPTVTLGSRDSIFGTVPLQQSTIVINNNDCFLNKQMHEASFKFAYIKSWILADKDMRRSAQNQNAQTIFFGYTSDSLTYKNDQVTIPCVDFFKISDNPVAMTKKYNNTYFPGLTIEPIASELDNEWFVRRIYGGSDGTRPVNVNFNASPATNTNRRWVVFDGYQNNANLIYQVDNTAPNTDNRTYFTTTPQVNESDSMYFFFDGSLYVSVINNVDRVNKFVEHVSFAGRVITALDTAYRPCINRVQIEDNTGVVYEVYPQRDYDLTEDASTGTTGFTLHNNFEGHPSFAGLSPFDPTIHKIRCIAYGPKDLPLYSDSTPVGMVTDDGGTAGQAVSILYRMLTEAGVDPESIDKTSFSSVGANSHTIGVRLPIDYAAPQPETYKEVIDKILQTMLWKLGVVSSGNELRVGLGEISPMTVPGDYQIDEVVHGEFSYEQDYRDVYFGVQMYYRSLDIYYSTESRNTTMFTVDRAKNLHFSTKIYIFDGLQFIFDEAPIIAKRLAYALSDRKAYLSFDTTQEFLAIPSVNVSVDLLRERMPGFEFEVGVENTRQGALTELQKSDRGVTIVVDDQKGIQDNAGSW